MFQGKKVDDYLIENEIGKGAFGSVHICRKIQDNSIHAIKIISFASLRNSDGVVGELLKDEISVLTRIDSPNVLKLEHYCQSSNNCYIIMEYCDSGDLDSYWEKNGRVLPEEKATDFIRQVLNGLRALHENNVIHRDLKLANILLHKDQVKLADLGFCKQLQGKDMLVSLCLGSPGTMAPEVASFESYGLQSDIFSIGCIFYQLLFGELPFDFSSTEQYLDAIYKQNINFTKNGVKVSKEVEQIISKMLKENPQERLTFPELYQYNLFKVLKISSQASMIAVQNLDNPKHLDFYQNIYNQNKDQTTFNQELLSKPNQQVDIHNTQQFIKQMFATQYITSPDPKSENIAFGQQQNIVSQPIFQSINPIFETEDIASKSQLQTTQQLYKMQEDALKYLKKVYEEIEQIKFSEPYRTYFPKFMILKKMKFKANQYFSEMQAKHKEIKELSKIREEFIKMRQDKTIEDLLKSIQYNYNSQSHIQGNWQIELNLNLDSNTLDTVYEESLKDLQILLKQETNKVTIPSAKKEILIVIIHVQQCLNFNQLVTSHINFEAEFIQIKKVNIIELLKRVP